MHTRIANAARFSQGRDFLCSIRIASRDLNADWSMETSRNRLSPYHPGAARGLIRSVPVCVEPGDTRGHARLHLRLPPRSRHWLALRPAHCILDIRSLAGEHSALMRARGLKGCGTCLFC